MYGQVRQSLGFTDIKLQLSSGCWVVAACPDGSPLQGQTPWWHVSHRPQASTGNPSPYQSSPGEWRKVVLLPGDLAVVYASPPALCHAALRGHEMEPRRSEGPEPGSHSSARCHSAERISVMPFERFSLLKLLIRMWYLQGPQRDIHVSINAICTEHGLLRTSGEG